MANDNFSVFTRESDDVVVGRTVGAPRISSNSNHNGKRTVIHNGHGSLLLPRNRQRMQAQSNDISSVSSMDSIAAVNQSNHNRSMPDENEDGDMVTHIYQLNQKFLKKRFNEKKIFLW